MQNPPVPPHLAQLATTLDHQLAAAQQLLAALAGEQAALTGPSPEALRTATTDKEVAVQKLETLEQTRRSAMAAAGVVASDMEAWAKAGAQRRAAPSYASTLGSRWQALLATLGQCRDANETNGQIAATRSRQVRQALQVLRGQAPEALTYGPGAAAPRGFGSRGLARA